MSSKVNGRTHATAAAGRNGGSGKLAELEYFPGIKKDRRFDLLDLLKGETIVESRTVNGERAVIRVPHSILAVLVTIALAVVAAGFWLVSSVTEMKTNLANIQQSQRENRQEARSDLKLMVAYATNETNRIHFMTALLTPKQREEVYKWDSTNPRPKLPDTKDGDDK